MPGVKVGKNEPILCVASKFVCNITTKGFIGWEKNGELLNWNLQTTS